MNGAQGTQHSALLIGVGNYSNPELPPLAGPSVDLRNMKAALENPQIGGYSVSTLEDVDSPAACLRIEEFLGSRSEDETVVLYYSGHGFIDRRGALYLCTTNSSFSTPRSSSIRADFVTDLIDNCASRRVLLLLDCCYSGNFEGAAKATSVIEPQFKGTGLGRVVLTAGAGDQLAWDLGDKGSLFSRHIVNGLTSGAADLDRDGRITVQELYDYVYREVTKEQPRQRPGKWTYREDGPSFLIAQSPIQPKRELPPELLHDLESDFPRTRASVLRELEGYARRNAWALDAVTEKLRTALNDDSDSVKIAAREILTRISGTTWTSPLKQATTASPAPSIPQPAVAHSQPASPTGDSTEEPAFGRRPLLLEAALWTTWTLLAPLLILPFISMFIPDFLEETLADRIFRIVAFLAAPLLVIGFVSVAAQRYRVIGSPLELLKSWPFRISLVAVLGLLIFFAASIRGYPQDEVAIVLGLISVVPYILSWKLLIGLRWRVTIPAGLLCSLCMLLSLGYLEHVFMNELYSSPWLAQYFTTCFASAPFIILLGTLARRRYLKTHGE